MQSIGEYYQKVLVGCAIACWSTGLTIPWMTISPTSEAHLDLVASVRLGCDGCDKEDQV